jgi:hypothetical protein
VIRPLTPPVAPRECPLLRGVSLPAARFVASVVLPQRTLVRLGRPPQRRNARNGSKTPCERPRRARTASTALSSTRAVSLIRGAFHRQVPPLPLSRREPATVPIALPPRAGFRRFFTLLGCSRREELDPCGGDGLFTRGRLNLAPLVNFCNRNEVRARLLDRSSPAHRAKVAFCAATTAGGRAPFGAQPAEISRARGPWW